MGNTIKSCWKCSMLTCCSCVRIVRSLHGFCWASSSAGGVGGAAFSLPSMPDKFSILQLRTHQREKCSLWDDSKTGKWEQLRTHKAFTQVCLTLWQQIIVYLIASNTFRENEGFFKEVVASPLSQISRCGCDRRRQPGLSDHLPLG